MSGQDYLVFDAFTDPAFWSANDAPKVAHLIRSGAYKKVFDGAGIVVLARSARASGEWPAAMLSTVINIVRPAY